MRVCILISGYLRTFSINYPNIKKFIIDKYENVDIYFHITSDEQESDKYLNYINKDLDFIIKTIKPIVLLYEKNNKDISNLYNLWNKYYRLNLLKSNYEKSNHFQYDLVIKLRPDMYINNDFIINNPSTLYVPIDSKIDKTKLTNITDNYLCDIFAYSNSNIMDKYFDIYNHLDNLIKQYGNVSETLLYHYLNDNHISYELIDIKYDIILSSCNIFAICGDSGSGKSTLGSILKNIFNNSFIMECDRYHKWERGDPNWNLYTHLNPEANYIMKMSDDIFNLKIKNEIYQIDYDHKDGKFTEKQQISPSDNIIVCGLHCLYSNINNVFNIKIFIDTDENLKIPWKIQRDIKKRNYIIEKILKQINDRKEDYNKYILPQQKDSDIIINFFTDHKWDINSNIYETKNIYLRLLINEKYNCGNICLLLNKYNIEYKTESKNEFIHFIFYKYSFHPLLFGEINLDIPILNNYYDLIIFFIFFINYIF